VLSLRGLGSGCERDGPLAAEAALDRGPLRVISDA